MTAPDDKPNAIYRVHHYVNGLGQRIEAHYTAVSLTLTAARFIGHGNILVNKTETVPLPFDIPASTIEDAFGMFRECLEKRGKEFEASCHAQALRRKLAPGIIG